MPRITTLPASLSTNVRIPSRRGAAMLLLLMLGMGLPARAQEAPVTASDDQYEDRVEIEWALEVASNDLFRIERDGALLSLAASDDTLYVDVTGDPGMVYTYCVTVIRSDGSTFDPECDDGRRILFAPTGVRATDGIYDGFVQLTWTDASSLETGYVVSRDGTPIDTADANLEFYRDLTAKAGTSYEYCLAALDAVGFTSTPTCDVGERGFILPPVNLTASYGQYPDRVVLSWMDQADDDTGYDITRDGTVLGTTAPDATQYEDLAPDAATVHTYCVVTLGTNDSRSVAVCADGGIGILPAATNVQASDRTFDDHVAISWADPSNLEAGYYVYRKPAGSDEDSVRIATTGPDATGYNDTGAQAGVAYRYDVIAFGSGGGLSEAASAEGEMSPVLAPAQVAATDDTHEDRVVVTWTNSSTTAAVFKVFRDGELQKTLAAAQTSYEDEWIASDVTYTYCVQAVTALGTESAQACDDGSRHLKPPTNVAASDDEFEDRVRVTWVDQSQVETGYRIYRDGAEIALTDANRTAYVDLEAVPGTSHDYAVRAADFRDDSAPASDKGRRTLNAPSNLTASDGIYEQKVVLSWVDNSRVETGYGVYRKAIGASDSVQVGFLAANETAYTDAGMDVGVAHVYSVVATDAYGASASVSAPGSTALRPPGSFSASTTYDDRVVLTWADNSAVETGYRILRDGTELDEVPAGATSYTDTTVPAGREVEYCTVTVGSSATSVTVCATGGRGLEGPATTTVVELRDRLLARDGDSGDLFGRSVALDGDVAVIGASQDEEKGAEAGAAYVFRRDGATWQQEAKIINQYGGASNWFGLRVAATQNMILVGSPREGTGFVWVFKYDADNGTWVESGDIGGIGEEFGWSLDVDGDHLIVGAPKGDGEIGTVWIYKYNTDSGYWSQVTELPLPNGTGADAGMRYGESVAIHGNYAIIGAPLEDVNGTDSGRSIFFERVNGTWQFKLSSSSNQAGANLGQSVDISAEYAVVGQPGHNDHGTNAGAVTLYRRAGNTWDSEGLLFASDASVGARFGSSVKIDGNFLLVGAQSDSGVGAVYVFTRQNGTWVEQAKFVAEDPNTSDFLGVSLALDGGYALFGLHRDDSNGTDAGAVFPYELLAEPGEVTASDAEYDNRIGIRWKDRGDAEHGFRIYRDGALLETIEANTTRYSDMDAAPGRVYTYCVTAFNELQETAPMCDYGRRSPNGAITGRVATGAGAGVQGVPVCLMPPPGRSLLLDGTAVSGSEGSHVRIADAVMPDSAVTVEFWMRSSDAANAGMPFSYAVPGQANLLLMADYRNFEVYLGGAGSGASGVSANDGQWHHIAMTWRSTDGYLALYKDGELAFDRTGFATGSVLPSGGILVLGQDQDNLGGGFQETQAFKGQLDEVRVWRGERDAAAIRELMGRSLRGDEDRLVGYWPLEQGTGRVVADQTGNARYGSLEEGVHWSIEHAPLAACAVTDLEGNYALEGIRYGTETTFRVTPEDPVRQFEPAFKTITLSTGNPVQNEVAFIDISSYTVSGFVQFAEAQQCALEGIEVLVDGESLGATDKDGRYSVPVQIGEHALAVRYSDHTFEPGRRTLQVAQDQAEVNFANTTTRTLSGYVGGGCGFSIGTVTLKVFTENNCFSKEIEVDGNYQIELPPQKYLVQVLDVDPPDPAMKADMLAYFDQLGPQEVDLTESDTTLDLFYRAPLLVEIEGMPAASCPVLGVPVLEQGDQVNLTVNVAENYGQGNLCPVDTGTVTIYDEIIDEADTPVELKIENGQATYTTAANTPNFLTGRVINGVDRSYQKALTAVVDVVGRTKQETAWAIVTGHRPREGSSFVARADGLPILILRDPPGDHSYAYFEEGEQICHTYGNLFTESLSGTIEAEIKAGIKFEKGTPFFSTKTAAFVLGKTKFEIGIEATQNDEVQVCTTFKERFSTSDLETFVGADADVYLGMALNALFAKTDILAVDGCEIKASQGVTFGGQDIETTYLFTQGHIRNSLVPQFRELARLVPDSAAVFNGAADAWNGLLGLNSQAYKAALPKKENRSFSAGAEYEYAFTSEEKSAFEWSVKAFTNNEAAVGLGFEESGNEGKVLYGINLGFSYQRTERDETTQTETVGYVFNDDDLGDSFTIDVKDDPLFGTPVFALTGGTTSTPYEPGTVPRDDPSLSITPPERNNVDPDGAAAFTLFLGNSSQSEETREYHLRAITTTNPYGARLAVNGGVLNGPVSYFIDPGQQQEVTLSMERGPNRYRYDSLAVMLYPPGEYAIWENNGTLQRADTLWFNVRYQAPCSDIAILRPKQHWAISRRTSGDPLEVILHDFTLDNVDGSGVTRLGMEYRAKGTSDWLPAFAASRNQVIEFNEGDPSGQSYLANWEFPAQDGTYELRAFTECPTGKTYSGVTEGQVDTELPQVLGQPEPADEVLALGDNIAITLNEPIACGSVRADGNAPNVFLRDAATGDVLPIQATCAENRLVLNPTGNLAALENKLLDAEITVGTDEDGGPTGVTDRAGNPLAAPVTWSFTVRRSSFAWSKVNLELGVPLGTSPSFQATLANGSAQPATYAIEDIAPWLTPSRTEGELPPGGTQNIRFAVADTLAPGVYQDTVAARSDRGDALLYLAANVYCQPPRWTVAPGFPHSMTLTSEVYIDGVPTTDTSDVVAAFVGNELRGVASVQYREDLDRNLAFLTIFSDVEQGETVTFRVWDASSCRLFGGTEETVPFVANDVIGSPTDPATLTATDVFAQSVALTAGWTWISTNMNVADQSVGAVLSTVNPSAGDVVKSQTAFAQYDASLGWVGSLTTLAPGAAYLVNLKNEGQLFLLGDPVEVASTPIDLAAGWNWIGYLPQQALPVDEALQGLDASDGDLIKSQTAFAQYVESIDSWVGSLEAMEPGLGYLMKVAASRSFSYPVASPGVLAAVRIAQAQRLQQATLATTVASADTSAAEEDVSPLAAVCTVEATDFPYSMSVIAAVEIDGLGATEGQIGAFVGDECRGRAVIQNVPALGRHLAFLTVYGRETAGEPVMIRLLDEAGTASDIGEADFKAEAVMGAATEPLVLDPHTFDLPTEFALAQNYPNPFNPATIIQYELPEPVRVRLAVYDALGRQVALLVDGEQKAGRYEMTFEDPHLASGVYFYRIQTGRYTKVRKMLLVK